MKRLTDILKRDLLRRIICFLVLQFCCLSIMQPYSFAADQNNSAQTSDTNGSGVSEPSYYQDAKVTHTKNRKGEQVEFVSVKNAYKYVKQDTNYLTQITLNNNVTSEDIAYLLQRYPSTLGSFDGTEAVQEERIVDKLDDMKDDGEITEDQYKNARRKISLAFDELYKQSMRQAIAVGEGNVESFDPSKLTSDPAYHRAYNRAVRDEKDGIFTEEETETRKQDYISDGLAKKHVIEKITSPKECDIDGMRKQYQSKCYSCVIIKTLLETFLNACSKAYDITSEAGVKLLVLGALVWMAFFVMKNVSSLSNIEPGAMMNTLTVFLFKVMVAYILITSGLGVLIKYTINPLLTAGADFGIAFMSVTSDISGAPELNANYAVTVPTISAPDGGAATEIVSSDVMNRIMFFAQNLDKNVSTNLVIGHAMTCWSMKGGAWDFEIFKMVNLWLWFCGALIWFVGFMLTLGIGYYLLDISFKLGFAIMALPVVIGLWPFNVTKGKVTAVISIMLKAAGTFVFLALTTTYALAMIDVALRDVPTLFDKIEKGESEWISNTFDLTGPYFLIILFVYLYSMKLILSTVSDYVDKFFKDSVFGGADPMHGKLTQMTDFAKQQAMRPVKWAGGKASDAVKKQATEGAAKAGKFVRGLFKGKANGDQEKDDKGGGNPVSGGGTAIKNTGKGAKAAGATMEQSGKGVQAAGKGVEAGGKAAQAGGKGLMSAGKGLSATGLGAIVGVPMMIAGAAVYGAGKGAEVAGKVTQKAGKAMQKGGKAMKKVGEKMEKAGEKMEKMGNKLKFGDEKAPEPENKDNSSEGESSRPEEQNKPEKPDNGNKPENGK